MDINNNFKKLEANYMFTTVNRKVAKFCEENPDKKVIRLGIGDVTRPLCACVISAMHKAVDEMGTQSGFHGYGPEQGYDFLKEKIQNYYKQNNVDLKLNTDYTVKYSNASSTDVGTYSLTVEGIGNYEGIIINIT